MGLAGNYRWSGWTLTQKLHGFQWAASGQFETVEIAGIDVGFSAEAAGNHFPQPAIQERLLLKTVTANIRLKKVFIVGSSNVRRSTHIRPT